MAGESAEGRVADSGLSGPRPALENKCHSRPAFPGRTSRTHHESYGTEHSVHPLVDIRHSQLPATLLPERAPCPIHHTLKI